MLNTHRLSHVLIPNLECFMQYCGTLELFSGITTQRSWWDPGTPVNSGSDSGQTHGPGSSLASQLEVMPLPDEHSRVSSPHNALAYV